MHFRRRPTRRIVDVQRIAARRRKVRAVNIAVVKDKAHRLDYRRRIRFTCAQHAVVKPILSFDLLRIIVVDRKGSVGIEILCHIVQSDICDAAAGTERAHLRVAGALIANIGRIVVVRHTGCDIRTARKRVCMHIAAEDTEGRIGGGDCIVIRCADLRDLLESTADDIAADEIAARDPVSRIIGRTGVQVRTQIADNTACIPCGTNGTGSDIVDDLECRRTVHVEPVGGAVCCCAQDCRSCRIMRRSTGIVRSHARVGFAAADHQTAIIRLK